MIALFLMQSNFRLKFFFSSNKPLVFARMLDFPSANQLQKYSYLIRSCYIERSVPLLDIGHVIP